MKFAFLFALAAAQIHLQSPISRNLTTAATEDETAQLTGPCGGKTVPGPRSQQPLQFSISLDSKNSNAEIWINAAAGENPTTFPSSLFNANFTNAGPVTIAIDLSQIPGLNGLTPATVQIIQTSADTTHDRFICLDLLVNAPVVTTTSSTTSSTTTTTTSSTTTTTTSSTTTTTTSSTTTVHMAASIPANSEMAATVPVDTTVAQTTILASTIGSVMPTPNAGYFTPGAVYNTPGAVYTNPMMNPSTTDAPKISGDISMKPLWLLVPFIFYNL